jgi:hypothetical protein
MACQVREALVMNAADSSTTVRVRASKEGEWRELVTFPYGEEVRPTWHRSNLALTPPSFVAQLSSLSSLVPPSPPLHHYPPSPLIHHHPSSTINTVRAWAGQHGRLLRRRHLGIVALFGGA